MADEKELSVRFNRHAVGTPYFTGDVARFPAAEARRFVDVGTADPVGWSIGVEKEDKPKATPAPKKSAPKRRRGKPRSGQE